ncbi:hypothetical protein LTR84_012358 [Exophiala bonariae]|uniref:Carrier domain-containing protein n=1 Tax=Exophiala bonariae TaxID=1690606 RepID=A0AAV9NKE6_9EURO|nr:hypothetical protein LTR84_012358 [Exophiala bonariae]
MEPTYFTCTLGQAKLLGQRSPFRTVNELINIKAANEGDTPAVGFYKPCSESTEEWRAHILTFRDVARGCEATATSLVQKLHSTAKCTVALLCPSSPEFLFTWLALMKLGHSVLLIAPQCSPSAISHLCQTCDVQDLIYDDQYKDLAQSTLSESTAKGAAFNIILHPFSGQDVSEAIGRPLANGSLPSVQAKATEIAYLHHTSGTSSGVPKPIAQSHHAAVGALPTLDGRHAATFTTTPLYHGGIADLFRAWTSNALIWLFPGKQLPITANNVGKCLEIAKQRAEKRLCPPVQYFSSVPYILQMMAGNEEGLKLLQGMEIVGVGGAALPSDVGNMLVERGVHLISRFGSAECGFLMSSHRDYGKDKAWDYLRSSSAGDFLQFEEREDNLLELVIQQGWPHMAKHNRKNGSFATADLFMPHPSIVGAWRYHSRSDSQLTLVTGKKFDPAPLEDAIKASSTVIEDVLIFGNGKPYAGALLFRTKQASSLSEDEFVDSIVPVIEKLNKESQSHAKISRAMLIPMKYEEKPLQKSSKGTTIRTQAEKKYSEQINAAYNGEPSACNSDIADAEIPQAIREIVLSVVGSGDTTHLSYDTDLFSYGADSVACMQIRQRLSRLIPGAAALPVSVVEDCGTIDRLSTFIIRLRSGAELEEQDDQIKLMSDLVDKYRVEDPEPCSAPSSPSVTQRPPGLRVLLTGPTGSLGSHLLHQLLNDARVGHIYLLVRGASTDASLGRVTKALTSRGLDIPSNLSCKTTILPCKLSEPNLGLSCSDYETLSNEVDIIFHLAWSVNFLISLRTIANTQLSGLRNLLNLALARPPHSDSRRAPARFVFCSSVAAVSNFTSPSADHTSSTTVPEQFVAAPNISGPTGYARSKWVGEAICSAAHEITRLKGHISIARVGQLSGATDTGAWSSSEAYPLLLSSAKDTGVLPDLKDEVLNWLPVDVAARAFLELAFVDSHFQTPPPTDQINGPTIPVHHVLNPNMAVRWSDLLSWLSRHSQSRFTVVSAAEWLEKLTALQADEATKHHPALRLLEFWRNAYGAASSGKNDAVGAVDVAGGAVDGAGAAGDKAVENEERKHEDALQYNMTETFRAMPVLRDVEDCMDEAYVLKLWEWVQREL